MDFPPSSAPVHQLFTDFRTIKSNLPADAVSDQISLDTHFRKLLVLATASHLESLMYFHVKEYFADLGPSTYEFVRRSAIESQFFRWFDFKSPKPASFFKGFGKECHALYTEKLNESDAFEQAGLSFMLLCATRNSIIHTNLAEASFELTPGEIENHYRRAVEFPDLALRVVKEVG